MPLSTTVIVLRVDCITENFGRVERGCLGDMGGVGYCVEFFRQKNIDKLFIDSWRTLWNTRVSLYNKGYIWAVCPIAAIKKKKKKWKKFLNTPLRINAVFDRLVAFPRKREQSFVLWKLQAARKKDWMRWLRDDARRYNATAWDKGSRGRERQSDGRVFTDSPIGEWIS